jgi:hypothetical protein
MSSISRPSRFEHTPRKPLSEVTADREDAALFQGKLVQLTVELVPQMRRTEHNDLIVRGFASGHHAVEIHFAGRRAKDAGPLEARLRALLMKARQNAKANGMPAPEVDHIRCPVRVEGAWRPQFSRDESGWETRTYHLVAARWSMADKDGNVGFYGITPQVMPSFPV